MGSDMSGVVVKLGSACNASHLHVGSEVWADIGAVTYLKPSGSKSKENGAYAQYAVALDSQLGLKPGNIDFAEAGVLPKVALTSWKALNWFANAGNWSRSQKGPVVLILGGSGGTGSTGLQLAKAYGASEVITTTSKNNFEYCRSLGATRLIDYKTTNWWEVIANNSIDILYDTVGQTGTGDRALGCVHRSFLDFMSPLQEEPLTRPSLG